MNIVQRITDRYAIKKPTKAELLRAFTTLTQAADLIAKPEHHCTQASARDAKGNYVPPQDDRACSWCMIGSMQKIDRQDELACKFIRVLVFDKTEEYWLAEFNDKQPHATVLATMQEAANLAKEQYEAI